MSDWASTLLRSVPRLSHVSTSVMAGGLEHVETAGSAVYPAANRALYFPMLLDTPVTVTQMWAHNGATAKGKLDLGIYDEALNRLVNKGLTTQEGTSTIQLLNITDTFLPPGLYYLAITSTSAEATFLRSTSSNLRQRAAGAAQQALGSEIELPATATFAAPASSFVPIFGCSFSDQAVF